MSEPTPTPSNFFPLLGLSPSSKRLESSLTAIAPLPVGAAPEIKAFSDSVYFNLYDIGISLVFHPKDGYRPKRGSAREELDSEKLFLASVDIYNHQANLTPPTPSTTTSAPRPPSSLKRTFAPFPSYPIAITHPSSSSSSSLSTLLVNPKTTGKDFVVALGEPDRKGGGEGSIGIWTEWTQLGVMVEFASGGLQAWDKGGDAVWKTVTIFERGVMAGKEDDEE